MSTVDGVNALPEEEVRRLLRGCLDVPRWVDVVLAGRPYSSREDLLAAADAAARTLDAAEVDAALAGHPRIGERAGTGHNVEASEREQAGISGGADVANLLAEANADYERRFDRVFLIRAAGRSAEDVLGELRRRMGNDDATERAEVADNLRQIALLRLEQVATRWEP
jgi:2-oxo-4-hydroxy-4-carboxy-5-ureidoimidazoline decarboxylase